MSRSILIIPKYFSEMLPFRNKMRGCLYFLVGSLILAISKSDTILVIDVGSEFTKVAAVSPSKPYGTVLNEFSDRKSPTIISFQDDNLQFGNIALRISEHYPVEAIRYFLNIFDKQYDNETVEVFRKKFPYYNITQITDQGVAFQHSGKSYSIEDLLAVVFRKCHHYAEAFTRDTITDVILTVPPFFSIDQKKSVLIAANRSQLNVLEIINSNTAVALHYGTKMQSFAKEGKYVLFYDMGSSHTVATIVFICNKNVPSASNGQLYTSRKHLSVEGVGYDTSLGGLEMTLRVRDFLTRMLQNVSRFNDVDISSNPRALAKLLQEAEKIKISLSAINVQVAQIGGILDRNNIGIEFTRSQFDDLNADLYARATFPIEDALKHASILKDKIDKVVLVGGGSRVPGVQEVLSQFLNKKLEKSVNADEAIVLGAAEWARTNILKTVEDPILVFDYVNKSSVIEYPATDDFHFIGNGTEPNNELRNFNCTATCDEKNKTLHRGLSSPIPIMANIESKRTILEPPVYTFSGKLTSNCINPELKLLFSPNTCTENSNAKFHSEVIRLEETAEGRTDMLQINWGKLLEQSINNYKHKYMSSVCPINDDNKNQSKMHIENEWSDQWDITVDELPNWMSVFLLSWGRKETLAAAYLIYLYVCSMMTKI